MSKSPAHPVVLCGRAFVPQELDQIQQTVRLFPRLSRTELAKTLCEHLDWVTPTGRYKISSCRQLLDTLARQGRLTLPAKRAYHQASRPVCAVPVRYPDSPVRGDLADVTPITVEPVTERSAIREWNQLLHQCHPLGYQIPFGAHQRYFIRSARLDEPLGCFLFAAAAWALADRDRWIGWTRTERSLRLYLVVNNTRFLIRPRVRIKHLASHALSRVIKRVGDDWFARYGYRPVLLETFVDPTRYRGTAYRAANWFRVGRTAGRGRMDRHTRRLLTPKDIYLYPLTDHCRAILRGGERP